MMTITIVDQIQLIAFWLCFTRWLTIMFQLPLFDHNAVPFIVKVLTALIVSYAFFPMVRETMILEVTNAGVENFWWLTMFHAIIGLTIGYLVKSIMTVFLAAGTLMTQQIGFTSVSYFDPNYVSRVGPFEKIIHWTLLIMILSSGALLPMFKGILVSFSSITWMSIGKFASAPIFFQEFFKFLFGTALMLAAPILFSNLLLNLVLGIVARTIPQMNILMVSFVVNIGIGLLIFLAISEEFFHVAYRIYVEKLGEWFQFII